MVTRYEFEAACCLGMEDQVKVCEDDFGEYVSYTDYATLWVDNLGLQNNYDELKEDHEDLKKDYDKVLDKLNEVSSKYLSEGELYYMWKDINSYD